MSQKVRLISAARHIYGGRLIRPNDHFDAEPQDAEDLIALHFAVAAPVVMSTTDASGEALTPSVPKRRTYRRRDMKAEE